MHAWRVRRTQGLLPFQRKNGLVLPSQYPEVRPYPFVRRLLEAQVDMQFADLRTLLMLPRPGDGLDAGCNLTTALLLTGIAAGASVLLWDASPSALQARGGRGKRFTALVERHYPWSADDSVTPEYGTKLLYDYTRNPLSHTLGIGKTTRLFPGIAADEKEVWLAKPRLGLSRANAEEVLSSFDKPIWLGSTVRTAADGHTFDLATLTWGIHRMLRNLLADRSQANQAETSARALFGE
jgi:hypothetical protein